ncbi:MAG TPA: hypothetical protein VNJ01_12000 [Bacteriovoracaceae bacterium]|nr:hypothetical protein [Bacteriovoracaceae bacterium]
MQIRQHILAAGLLLSSPVTFSSSYGPAPQALGHYGSLTASPALVLRTPHGFKMLADPDTASSNVAPKGTAQLKAAAVSTENILAVRLQFPDLTAQSCGTSELETTLFAESNSLSSYFKEMSRGTATIQGKVHPEVIQVTTKPDCSNPNDPQLLWRSVSTMANEAKNLLNSRGVNVSAYNKFLYYLPAGVCVTGYGDGTLKQGYFSGDWCKSLPVTVHEFGHMIGLNHASSADVQYPTMSQEYGDASDVMGYSNYPLKGMNAINKIRLGYVSDAEIVTVTADGQSHTISTVSPPLLDAGKPVVLRFEDLQTAYPIFLSFRRPSGFDSGLAPSFFSTLSVHSLNRYSPSKSWLIANVAVGQQLETPNGSKIILESITADRAVVKVTRDGVQPPPTNVCVRSAPSLTLPANLNLTAGDSQEVDLQVRNTDNAYCEATSFTVALKATSQFFGEFTPASLSLEAGESRVVKLRLTHLSGTGSLSYAVALSGHPSGTKETTASVTVAAAVDQCLRNAPVLSFTSALSITKFSTKELNVTVSNKDNSYCPETTFTLGLSPTTQLSSQFAPESLSLAPGESQTVRLALRHLSGTGSLGYVVELSGHPLGVKTRSGTVNTLTPASNVRGKFYSACPYVYLAWDLPVSAPWSYFRIYRNGVRIGSPKVKYYRDLRVTTGLHSYYVKVTDSSGNTSLRSSKVSVNVTSSTGSCR